MMLQSYFVASRKTERVKWCAIHVDAKPVVERIVELLRSGVVDATVSDNATRIVPVWPAMDRYLKRR